MASKLLPRPKGRKASSFATMHPPLRSRLRARPLPPATSTAYLPPGAVGFDVGGVLAQLVWRELLRELRLRGRV